MSNDHMILIMAIFFSILYIYIWPVQLKCEMCTMYIHRIRVIKKDAKYSLGASAADTYYASNSEGGLNETLCWFK